MLRRVTGLALVTVLLASALSCGIGTTKVTPSPTPSPSPVPTLNVGHITWAACSGGFDCGFLQVPLDYSQPNADSIAIALIRKRATTSSRIGSLLTNPGGPGASGIEFLRGEAPALRNLNRYFDLIGFDPRGVGQSAPIRCLDGPHADAFFALDPVLDDVLEKEAMIAAGKAFAEGCQQRSARVLPFVDTVSAARDIDLIRQTLGDEKLTYLGFSYGTFLGLTYASLFPTNVRALALDGVVDPNLSANDLILGQASAFEQNLQAFLSDCRAHRVATPRCGYAQAGDPGTKLTSLMTRLDSRPLPAGKRSLTKGLAIMGVITPLYVRGAWPVLDRALTKTDHGDGSALLHLSDVYFERNADGTYSNLFEANYAINCLDRLVPRDIQGFDQLGSFFERASPTFGLAFQYENLPCAYWPVNPTGRAGPLTASGAPPLLLVGGSGDPATPYAWAQKVHQQVAGSVLITRRGYGHTSYDVSACAKGLMDAYLINLALPSDGTICD